MCIRKIRENQTFRFKEMRYKSSNEEVIFE